MQVELGCKNFQLETTKKYSEENITTELDRKIKRIVENEGFIKYIISKKYISTNGGNYLGELYEIDVKGNTKDGDKELNIFIKKIIDNKDSVKIISVSEAYKNELFVYKQLSKIFEELQDKANIPIKDRFKMVKFFEGTDTDMMLMENISKKGYKTYDSMDVASLKFLELCVENIAKFHGLSFVMKEKHPEYFGKKLKALKHLYILEEGFKQMINGVRETTMSFIDEKFKEKVGKLYENLLENFAKYVQDDTIKTCLCHGDYRQNNIMMKEEDGDIQGVIPIDYQLIHYGCPVFDLLFLIYLCTDRDLRQAHMSSLKELYYNTLESFLKYFDLDANAVYPREEFEKVFKEKMDYGLFIALQFLPYMFVAEEDLSDPSQLFSKSFQVDSRFKDRIQDIIEEFVELGFI